MRLGEDDQQLNKVSQGPDGILASLFRTILYNFGVSPMKFAHLLEKYLRKHYNNVSSKEATSIRGNLKKELLKGQMSWKVFLKGLTFLGLVKLEITIKLHEPNGRVTIHEKTIILKDEDLISVEEKANVSDK